MTRIDLPSVIEPGAVVSPTGNMLVFVGQGKSGYGLYQLRL
jgi:hypothetical protein